MCFEPDSRPPVRPIAGGALDQSEQTLTSPDGTSFRGFLARPTHPTGAGIVVLPDVRGLHRYYEELALRFAEHGVAALAIDYFGRTAGTARHGDDFDHLAHVERTTFDGLAADVTAAAAHLREAPAGVERLFTVGFCFGGRLAFLTSTLGLGLAGSIGFYGPPTGPGRAGLPAPAQLADRVGNPILGLFGGADPAIPPEAVVAFDRALEEAAVPHRLVTYPGAPHSFFDRKAADHAAASAEAWDEVLRFIAHGPSADR